jgi:hypothetical protein
MFARRAFARNSSAAAVRLAVGIALAGLPAACLPSRAYLQGGDEYSAQIIYAGDFENVMRVAREHCARFERVPRLTDREAQLARFDCVAP